MKDIKLMAYFQKPGRKYVLCSILLFLWISIALLNSIFIDKHLSADGSYMFSLILEKGEFNYFGLWSRQFNSYFTQWLLVLGVRWGITDISTLSRLYGVGIYLTYLFSFIFCLYALRGQEKKLIAFPLFTMAVINLNVDFMLVSEMHTMCLLTWPILFLIVRNEWSFNDRLLLLILLISYILLYESAVITSLLFISILLNRWITHKNKTEFHFILIFVLISVITSIISALSIAYFTGNPGSKSSFVSSVYIIYKLPQVYIPVIYIMLYIHSYYFKSELVKTLLFIPPLWLIFSLFDNQFGLSQYESFSIRTLSVTLLPILVLIAFLWTNIDRNDSKAMKVSFMIFIVIFTLSNIFYSKDWRHFRKDMITVIRSEKGFVKIDETILRDSRCAWAWTNPVISVIWSQPCVQTILLNSHSTEPYDPHKTLIMRKYVNYDSFFLSVDSTVTVCDTIDIQKDSKMQ